MLNPFPILFLSMLAHFLLRCIVGLSLIWLGFRHVQKRHDLRHIIKHPLFPFGLIAVWWLALVEIVVGTMFVLGFYTQIAALMAIILSLKMLVFRKRFASEYIPTSLFYLLLLGASLSLFITGAGAFAFDLPI